MKLIPKICPQCASSLNFADNESAVVCSYCKTSFFVKIETSKHDEYFHILSLANIAEKADNFVEAYDLYSKALSLNFYSVEGWRGKGLAAGMQSTLIKNRFIETKICYEQSLNVASTENIDDLRIQYAKSCFDIAKRYFEMSLNHTIQFISLLEAQFEHADRCKAVIEFCEYACSIDNSAIEIKSFINDIANRCLKIRSLDTESTSYFKQVKEKYSEFNKEKEKEKNSTRITLFTLLMLIINFWIVIKIFNISNILYILFLPFFLGIAEFGIGMLIILTILQFTNPKK